jgi:hypothetical protein
MESLPLFAFPLFPCSTLFDNTLSDLRTKGDSKDYGQVGTEEVCEAQ